MESYLLMGIVLGSMMLKLSAHSFKCKAQENADKGTALESRSFSPRFCYLQKTENPDNPTVCKNESSRSNRFIHFAGDCRQLSIPAELVQLSEWNL